LSEWGGKLDCHTCDDEMRRQRGHDREGIVPFLVDKKRIFRCPLTQITAQSYEFIKAYSFYEKGFLPNAGGWLDQSNKFVQGILVLDNTFNKIRNKELDKNGK